MATTTTSNYGWVIPQNDELVSNGAAAIRTLGNSADTTVKSIADGRGLVHINTTTIGSTVSSTSLPANTFTSTYDDYLVLIDFSTTTAFSASQTNINFRLRASGTDATGTNYNWNGWNSQGATIGAFSDSSVAQQYIHRVLGATPTRYACQINLYGIALAQETKYIWNAVGMDGGTNNSGGGAGWHLTASAYDSMTIYPTSGTMSGGKIRVYGYRNG